MAQKRPLSRRWSLFLRFRYRLLSAGRRTTPDYIVIGGQKCGTTSLHRYIKQHPNIVPPFKKDSSYFDANYFRGFNWYRAHFPLKSRMDALRAGGRTFVTGEVTTTYIHHPLTPERISRDLGALKFIALLRNPAIRAYSHYQHMVRTGREDLSFPDAIQKEDERLSGVLPEVVNGDDRALLAYRNYSYKSRGRYAEQLQRWFSLFPRENFLLLRSEDLFENPEAVCRQVYDFLGLPAFELDSYENANPGRYSEADTRTIQELERYFQPYNQQLYDLLKRDFEW